MCVILELNKRKFKSHYGTSFPLESLAWSCASFKKAFQGLSDQTANLIRTEEFGRFLKKCIQVEVVPTKEQLYGCTNPSQKKISFVELFLEDKETEKKLEEGKQTYKKYLSFALDSIDSSFQDILLNEIIKNALLVQKQVKWNYISEVDTLKKNSASKYVHEAVSRKSLSELNSSGHYSTRKLSTEYFANKTTWRQPETNFRQRSTRQNDQSKKYMENAKISKEMNPSTVHRLERISTQRREEAQANALAQISVMLDATSMKGK